jgi:hypothetical protein
MSRGSVEQDFDVRPGGEHTTLTVHSLATGTPRVTHGNVRDQVRATTCRKVTPSRSRA